MLKQLMVVLGALLICFASLTSHLEALCSPPFTISSTTSDESQIGIDGLGNAIAIWREFDGVSTNVQSAILPKGGSWSAPVTISSALGDNIQANPQIAITPSGDAVAIWEELNGGVSTVKSSTFPVGGGWSLPVTLSAPTINSGQVPQIAITAFGYAVAVWQRYDGVHSITQAATSQFGGSWSTPVDLSSTSIDTFVPQVALDVTGNAVVVWVDVTTLTIQGTTLPFGGTWSAPVNLSATGGAGEPQVAISPFGYAVADWSRFNGSFFAIQAATLQFGGSWSAPIEISTPGSTAIQASIAVDAAGNAVAAWDQVIGADIFIQSAYLPFGGSWTAPVDLSAPGGLAFDSDVAFDAAGNAFAVWDRSEGVETIIQAAMLPFGGSWSLLCNLSNSGETSLFPKIAVDPSGYAVAAWPNSSLGVIQSSALIPPPTVTQVNPDSGPESGGNSVIITGMNFIHVLSVSFGSVNALSFTVISPTQIEAIVPPGFGVVDVTVTTTAGTSAINIHDHYSHLPPIPPPITPPPLPPSNFVGVIKKNKFLNETEHVLFATWDPSPSPTVIFYLIFKNGKIVDKIPVGSSLFFEKLLHSKRSAKGYQIVAVSSDGQRSKRVKLRIKDD